MIIIIPAGGNGQRFAEAGYPMPKPCLPMEDGQPLLCRVIDSIPSLSDYDKVVIVARESLAPQIRTAIATYGEQPKNLHYVWEQENAPRGPLLGVLRAKQFYKHGEEVLISYCDCFLDGGDCVNFIAAMRVSRREAGAVVFDSSDRRFSRDPDSRYAVGGLFWFKDGQDFFKRAKRLARPEVGVPDVVWSYTQMGVNRYGLFRSHHYVDVGVPVDYEAYLAKCRTGESQ